MILSGFLELPPGRIEELRPTLAEHVRLTRAEPGCLCFDVTEDPEIPGRFNLYEEFVDPDAFRVHQRRSAASAWGRISVDFIRRYTVTGLTP